MNELFLPAALASHVLFKTDDMNMQINIGGNAGLVFICKFMQIYICANPYSHNDHKTCLLLGSKEDIKAVNISITNISCEI